MRHGPRSMFARSVRGDLAFDAGLSLGVLGGVFDAGEEGATPGLVMISQTPAARAAGIRAGLARALARSAVGRVRIVEAKSHRLDVQSTRLIRRARIRMDHDN